MRRIDAMDPLTGAGVSGRVLAAALLAALAWVAWGLVRHPGFQPVAPLRTAAPVLALVAGGGFTRLVASARARADAQREFDRGGKALFMGFVMVGATLVAWLLASQAIPATLTALSGGPADEPGVVVRKVPQAAGADCRYRLEVRSAALPNGALQRTLDECVDEALWRRAVEGGAVTLRLRVGALGAELAGVAPAETPR
jgi:hypothetical protein